eukprot:TRINITY_DN8352_c0_g1_i1.p1 TRINITY_DN8352_c0_g1~~TRINITY_DN8352_c0_g1_i1.p1  ORF type:complete len:197 (-),score=40.67 TRINITY_DN8352_c0_g1_i1:503-1093(-)
MSCMPDATTSRMIICDDIWLLTFSFLRYDWLFLASVSRQWRACCTQTNPERLTSARALLDSEARRSWCGSAGVDLTPLFLKNSYGFYQAGRWGSHATIGAIEAAFADVIDRRAVFRGVVESGREGVLRSLLRDDWVRKIAEEMNAASELYKEYSYYNRLLPRAGSGAVRQLVSGVKRSIDDPFECWYPPPGTLMDS